MKKGFSSAAVLVVLSLGVSVGECASLTTAFADVLLRDVPLGQLWCVEEHGRSFELHNTGETPLVVQVEAVKPEARELHSPAEPIPDVSWVLIKPASMTVAPHQKGRFDIVLSLPKEERLRNRMFQVMLWSRSAPIEGKGISVSAGLKSRLRFQTIR